MTASDSELLQEFIASQSQEAFTALVKRHLGLVYSAALRQVRSGPLAEEVAQSVFVDLACNASRLRPGTVLTAWLYNVARRTAIHVVRGEARRKMREQVALERKTINTSAGDWMLIEGSLDEAMDTLDETDRTAVLLRFFENKSLREVGETLGTSEDGAQKRVSRAVDRLRQFFARRGVAVGSAGLTLAISANAVQAAPMALAGTIAISAGVVSATTTAAITGTATKAIAMTTFQKSLIAATVVIAATGGVYQSQRISDLRSEIHGLQGREAPLVRQIQSLSDELANARARQTSLELDNQRLRQMSAEVPRLRGEVAQLRGMEAAARQTRENALDPADPSVQNFLAVRAEAQKIAGYLEQMPEKSIPEIKLLTDVDWLRAAKEAKFDTDADIRRTLSRVRALAKNRIPLGSALSAFLRESGGRLPTELSELKPYIHSVLAETTEPMAVDDPTLDAILRRYQLMRAGSVNDFPPDAWYIVERSPVDKDYDTRAKFGNGRSMIIGTGLHSAGDPDDQTY